LTQPISHRAPPSSASQQPTEVLALKRRWELSREEALRLWTESASWAGSRPRRSGILPSSVRALRRTSNGESLGHPRVHKVDEGSRACRPLTGTSLLRAPLPNGQLERTSIPERVKRRQEWDDRSEGRSGLP